MNWTYWASSAELKASRSNFIVGIAATTVGSRPLIRCSGCQPRRSISLILFFSLKGQKNQWEFNMWKVFARDGKPNKITKNPACFFWPERNAMNTEHLNAKRARVSHKSTIFLLPLLIVHKITASNTFTMVEKIQL